MPEDAYMQDMVRKRRKILRITMITAICLTASVWIMLFIFSRVMEPSLARECREVLEQAGIALKIYAGEHGSFPADPVSALGKPLSCPSGPEGEKGYLYLGPLKRNPPEGTLILFDAGDNHTGGRNVLFADGTAQWYGEGTFRMIARRMLHPPFSEEYSDDALALLEGLGLEEGEEPGMGTAQMFGLFLTACALCAAVSWIVTFISMLRYIQIFKYGKKPDVKE